MRLLVTGGTGFLGSRTIHFLKEKHEILVLTRSLHQVSDQNVDYMNVDLYLAHPSRAGRIDAVLHLATNYARSLEDTKDAIFTNLTLPFQILLNHYGTLKEFVNIETYYNKFNFRSHLPMYGQTKKSFSEFLDTFTQSAAFQGQKIRVTELTLEHVYGPGDSPLKFIPTVATRLSRDLPVLLSSGIQRRDFVYVDDAARAISLVVLALDSHYLDPHQRGYIGGKIQVGSGQSIQVREMVRRMAELSGSKSKIVFGALETRSNEILDSFADTRDLTALGWRNQTQLDVGLRKTLLDYK